MLRDRAGGGLIEGDGDENRWNDLRQARLLLMGRRMTMTWSFGFPVRSSSGRRNCQKGFMAPPICFQRTRPSFSSKKDATNYHRLRTVWQCASFTGSRRLFRKAWLRGTAQTDPGGNRSIQPIAREEDRAFSRDLLNSPVRPDIEATVSRTCSDLTSINEQPPVPIKDISKPASEDAMMTRRQANIGLLSAASVALAGAAPATEAKLIQLPPARTSGGKPLTEALRLRRSTREYSSRPLDLQVLSDLLWSAYGINRPSGDRTAPYWRQWSSTSMP